jgi:sigma54-dependent transcription regulator
MNDLIAIPASADPAPGVCIYLVYLCPGHGAWRRWRGRVIAWNHHGPHEIWEWRSARGHRALRMRLHDDVHRDIAGRGRAADVRLLEVVCRHPWDAPSGV